MTLEVECLVCSYVYPESDTFVDQCERFGNTDTEKTIYLQIEEITA